jgi:hypothetical protein
MPRYRTLKEIEHAGLDVRLWCYRCQRVAQVDGIIYRHFTERGLSDDLGAVQPYFRCEGCGGRDALILPCTRPRRAGDPRAELVAGWFHAMRAANRRRR